MEQLEFTLRIESASSALLISPLFAPSSLDARRAVFKSYLIQRYCAEDTDAEIVSEVFELLPELRGA
jgi:hypothetical protein